MYSKYYIFSYRAQVFDPNTAYSMQNIMRNDMFLNAGSGNEPFLLVYYSLTFAVPTGFMCFWNH